jgi:Fe-S cluster assembly iron-binding protein IscA
MLSYSRFMTETVGYKRNCQMNLNQAAKQRLTDLLPEEAKGFSVTGFLGTCRGSTPVLHPVQEAQAGQETMACEEITFFVNEDLAADFRECAIDYDRSLFGKGLTVTWPHREGCACHS